MLNYTPDFDEIFHGKFIFTLLQGEKKG